MANLLSNFLRIRIGKSPSNRSDLPIVEKDKELNNVLGDGELSNFGLLNQLNSFRMLSNDRDVQYDTYDDMGNDPIIAAALEIYADEATQYDEQGRIIWVESDDEDIARAGNRLLDILEIPSRAWKHIYMACKYGDYYLKLYRLEDEDNTEKEKDNYSSRIKIVNDKQLYKDHEYLPPYEEYVEDVADPSTMFDLRVKGKCAGFIEVERTKEDTTNYSSNLARNFANNDINLYPPDMFVHIMVSENMVRTKETVTLDLGNGDSGTYDVSRGKSVLYDVYPVQKELQLLEDALLLNRLTRSSLIRLLEVEIGEMPKEEVNKFLRRMKNLIEQHISMDKGTGDYKSYQAPGPIENVVYIPVRNGKGHISINNLGGDVNVKDIADLDYFKDKRSGALKIPNSYLGDTSGEGGNAISEGSLTKISARFARTIKRIQTCYIRAITNLLNLFFLDKRLDYINKFKVRMTSPSTQEDLDRNELVNGNIDVVKNLMDLTNELEGDSQKKILEFCMSNIIKMPDIAEIIREDMTPSDEFEVDVQGSGPSFNSPGHDDFGNDFGMDNELADLGNELDNEFNSPSETASETPSTEIETGGETEV